MSANLPHPQHRLLTDIEPRLLAAREQDAGAGRKFCADARVDEIAAARVGVQRIRRDGVPAFAGVAARAGRSGDLFVRATDDWFAQRCAQRVSGASEAEVMDSLRRFRKRHMVRIAWRDIAGWADLDETLRDLSALADACIDFACACMYEALVARYGTPRGADSGQPQPLMILGMGKLGGGELNFSSDIDLILLYPEDGETDGARCDRQRRVLPAARPEDRAAARDADGRGLRLSRRPAAAAVRRQRPRRIELRRPSSTTCRSMGATGSAMRTSKRVPLTAIEHYAALYDEVLRPFVYRRYLDYSVFESLREMKAMISREVERRELQDNVKLGPGGIREIEFIVQAFQLIRGGSDRRLQSRELRTVLPLLVGQRFLGREAVTELEAAYRYLRVVENRLQQWNDEQTHQLPEDGARARERLALAMGAPDWSALHAELAAHRQRVAHHFTQTVFGPGSPRRPSRRSVHR